MGKHETAPQRARRDLDLGAGAGVGANGLRSAADHFGDGRQPAEEFASPAARSRAIDGSRILLGSTTRYQGTGTGHSPAEEIERGSGIGGQPSDVAPHRTMPEICDCSIWINARFVRLWTAPLLLVVNGIRLLLLFSKPAFGQQAGKTVQESVETLL